MSLNENSTSLVHLLKKSVARFQDKIAVEDENEQYSYKDFENKIDQISYHLYNLGISQNDRVLIISENSCSFALVHFSVLNIGAVSVPCDHLISEHSFEFIYNQCKPKFVLLDEKAFMRLENSFLKLKINSVLKINNLLTVPEVKNNYQKLNIVNANDIATLMFTTGSTGAPKGVPLSHFSVMSAIDNIMNFVGYNDSFREVIALPLSHNFGLGHLYCNLFSGGSVRLEKGFSKIGRVLKSVENFEATGFPGTPASCALLLNSFESAFSKYLRNLNFMVINSAPLPPELTSKIRSLLPDLNIFVYYGLTEASRSTFISLTQEGENYYKSVGKPMNQVNLKIVNEINQTLEPNQIGEVIISGPHVAGKYWESPKEDQAAYKNGFLYTGDLGYLDQNGFLFITGRIKDQINVGGYKVSPVEIENLVSKLNGIRDCAVVGVDRGTSEQIVLSVVLDDKKLTQDEIFQYCFANLEKFKVPELVLFLDDLPRAESGKLKRNDLKNIVIEKLELEKC